VLALSASLLLAACDDGDDGQDPLQLIAACTATVSGAGARVYMNCGTNSAGLVSVDLFADSVTSEVDAYNIDLSFDPTVFRYMGFDPNATLFAPFVCNGGLLLCEDNADTNANTDGKVVYGVSLVGTNPPGVIPLNSRRLGRLTFEAASASQTSLLFGAASVGGCVGDDTTGNALMQVVNDPNNCDVSVIPGVAFSNQGSVTLSAALY
jgi:hypothetical protein